VASAELCIDFFVKLAELFPNWPKFFDVLAGKQFGDLATLQLNSVMSDGRGDGHFPEMWP
jgi:hypothetical protein